MSARNTIVCGFGAEGNEHALRRSYELARERELEVLAVHVVDLPLALLRQVDAEALEAARAAALDRAGPVLAELGGREALERDLRVVAGPTGRALLEAAREADAERLVLGEHTREGLTDLFGNTTRAVISRADCPVWIQKGPVQPVRKILVAVDLAPEGRQTVALAREEAAAFGAELELVHVFELPELGTAFGYRVPLPLSVVYQARETAQQEFAQLLLDFDWNDLPHHKVFLDGVPGKELVARAAEADLVVLGTHGGGGLSRALVGTVATELIRESQTPLLVFRGPGGDRTD